MNYNNSPPKEKKKRGRPTKAAQNNGKGAEQNKLPVKKKVKAGISMQVDATPNLSNLVTQDKVHFTTC